jgi:hypothetical protein
MVDLARRPNKGVAEAWVGLTLAEPASEGATGMLYHTLDGTRMPSDAAFGSSAAALRGDPVECRGPLTADR